MEENKNTIKYAELVNKALNNVNNQRTRDIIALRFGLNDGQKRTLEFIGQKYGITRERVRQVIDSALVELKKQAILNSFKPVFKTIDTFLEKEGNLCREERLLSCLTNCNDIHPARGAAYFIMTLGESYQRFVESNKFYPVWINSKEALNKAGKMIDNLVKSLEQKQEPVAFDYILTFFNNPSELLPKRVVFSYLDATKQISNNVFGQFGLSKWPEINPRGVKDKAYIILKEQKQPLHFRNVADLINKANLGTNLAQAQTVHNELIKDPRFILVGRGTYALKEWGYQPGTVKEVIAQVLKEKGPLSKEEILDSVLEKRLVKKNTVLINLQNRNYFAKDNQGRYLLVNSKK